MDEVTKKLNEIYELLNQMPFSSDLKEQLYEKENFSTIFEYMTTMFDIGNKCYEIVEEVDKEIEEKPIGKEDKDKLEVIKWSRSLTTLIKDDLGEALRKGKIDAELVLKIDEYCNYTKKSYEFLKENEKRKGTKNEQEQDSFEKDVTVAKTLEKLKKLKMSEKQMNELIKGLEEVKKENKATTKKVTLKDVFPEDRGRRMF